jgi:hypothetical protein
MTMGQEHGIVRGWVEPAEGGHPVSGAGAKNKWTAQAAHIRFRSQFSSGPARVTWRETVHEEELSFKLSKVSVEL